MNIRSEQKVIIDCSGLPPHYELMWLRKLNALPIALLRVLRVRLRSSRTRINAYPWHEL